MSQDLVMRPSVNCFGGAEVLLLIEAGVKTCTNLSLSVFIRVGRAWLLLLPVPNWPYELAPQA